MHAVYPHAKLREHAGPEAELLPLATSRAHAWLHPQSNYSHAWELTVRPYTAKPGAEIMQDTLRLIHRGCTCYDRIEGATGGVSLYNPSPSGRQRIRNFCRGALRVARSIPLPVRIDAEIWAAARPAVPVVLYESRKGTRRVIENDADIIRVLCPTGDGEDGSSGWQGSCVMLGALSMVQQMRTIAAASVLVGAHGQAMTWMPFMLSDRPRAAIVEVLFPKRFDRGSESNPKMYHNIALSLGIGSMCVRGELAPGCNLKADDVLSCNLTVGVQTLLGAVRMSVRKLSGSAANMTGQATSCV